MIYRGLCVPQIDYRNITACHTHGISGKSRVLTTSNLFQIAERQFCSIFDKAYNGPADSTAEPASEAINVCGKEITEYPGPATLSECLAPKPRSCNIYRIPTLCDLFLLIC